jgi:hypothetical protein
MDPFLASLASVIFVSLIIPRRGPFLSLIISAIVFGHLAGMGRELRRYLITDPSRIFSPTGHSSIQRQPCRRSICAARKELRSNNYEGLHLQERRREAENYVNRREAKVIGGKEMSLRPLPSELYVN